MNEYTQTLFSVVGPFCALAFYFVVILWKRKHRHFTYMALAGIFFNIHICGWGFVTRHFLTKSDVFPEEYGSTLASFYLDWYFLYFHAALLIGFVYLMVRRHRSDGTRVED